MSETYNFLLLLINSCLFQPQELTMNINMTISSNYLIKLLFELFVT